MKKIKRLLSLKFPPQKSAFLWGPRKVGKSYWLHQHFPHAIFIDFLKTDIFADYISRPALLRERYAHTTQRIIIDEVQMVPAILNEVHWLIENTTLAFVLTGSSPRKLRKHHANLLGGRAWRYTMCPLCYPEIPDLDLESVMMSGLLPPHYLSTDPMMELRAYLADYLKEEIAAEAIVQNIPAFAEFLKVAAITTGGLLNYSNIARKSGVSHKVVRSYFQILEDTLLGFRLSPWHKMQSRRLIETEKFYLFDVGVANYLARRQPQLGTPEFGQSFKHYILMECMAYKAYQDPELQLSFWRSVSGLEVDLIFNDMMCAVEIKASRRVHETDVKTLKILQTEYRVKKLIVVSFESEPKILLDNILCLPWQQFLEQLWSGHLLAD